MKSLNSKEPCPTLTTGGLKEVMSIDKWVNEYEPFYKGNIEPYLIDTVSIPTIKLEMIKQIMTIPLGNAHFCSRAYIKRVPKGYQVYFYMVLGENGHGSAFKDLGAATAILGLIENRAEFASFIQAERDCLDDISYWSMTFII